ncbi:helix-turn-helix domain-containing protein [Streptomyces sp. NBC_01236]|uniref:helix-turn-helix domain-containing protein n=1 Tax=Streptomyces sp. NBC_01236 TaxID=2903789 RepID=UPI002E0E1814|nr:helix-turn-helix domain-containing protein [Streptomyces sp. NBC_01236]
MGHENDEERPATVGMVVGENLRTARQVKRWTQDKLAAEVALSGLNWKRTHVADFENGRRETIDVGTLVVLAAACEMRLPDFFQGQGSVLLTPKSEYEKFRATVTREELRAWLSAGTAAVEVGGEEPVKAALDRFRHEGREIPIDADAALAERLGVSTRTVVDAALQVWDRSLTEERDRRVAALGDLPLSERQAKQGHITRQLTAILMKWMDAEGESDDG